MAKYILAVDQSTQGTKALLFDDHGELVKREDMPHRQIVSEEGYVSHDPEEIYQNTLIVVRKLMETSGVPKNEIAGLGISNQRETALVWDKKTRKPQALAIVWQCARSRDICKRIEEAVDSEIIRNKTGLILSPYFPASKFKWFLEHVDGLKERAEKEELCFGTVDTWLVYRLTGGTSYKTDYSNASRTQLFNIKDLVWDQELCKIFGLKSQWLAEVSDSDSCFGMTDFEGLFDEPIPIHSVLGDSHGALFSQGCLKKGMTKATYGTGSSVMMNTGREPVFSTHGLVTSLAWRMGGTVNYILEGNINYTGAVITWLKEKMNMISCPEETGQIAGAADQNDKVYLIPAFTGLGAPYWDSRATASISGMTRTTGRAEIVRAGLESIGYQITDVIHAMCEEMSCIISELRVDGGPTENQYLMQFQSDILGTSVRVSDTKELSGMGAALAAGLSLGIYREDIFEKMKAKQYNPIMEPGVRAGKCEGWRDAVKNILA